MLIENVLIVEENLRHTRTQSGQRSSRIQQNVAARPRIEIVCAVRSGLWCKLHFIVSSPRLSARRTTIRGIESEKIKMNETEL